MGTPMDETRPPSEHAREPRPGPDPDQGGTAAQRLVALDVVRGVAVLGILIANIIAFGQPTTAYSWPGAFLTPPGPFADALWGAQLVLVDGKFRGLFALLFGAGMVLFLRGAEAKGLGRELLARRLGWLALFGLCHWALLWRGDILFAYAAAGFAVLGFTRWDWPRQLALGLAIYLLGAVFSFAASVPVAATAQGHFAPGSHLAGVQAALRATEHADLAEARAEGALIAAGEFGGRVVHNLHHHLAALPAETAFTLLEIAPLMLIGMGLLNLGWFSGGVPARRQRRWGWGLWLAGTAATIPVARVAMARGITYWDAFAAFNGWIVLPHLASALGLAALLALWGARASGRAARLLAGAGRCAFTNYVGTSALAWLVFSGAGLGLFGTLGRVELYGIVLGFWAVMLAWPAWWLARFRHGPLEWLWRCLTYGRWFALRR